MNEEMCYVAADPEQPGAAWALTADDPRWKTYTAKYIAKWAKNGATVMHVPCDVAREMLKKWVRPAKEEAK